MFPPDADVSPYDPSTSTVSVKIDVVPRVVKHDNTRLPEQNNEGKPQSLSAPPSPTHSRIDAAIEGTPCKFIHTTFHPVTYTTQIAQSHQPRVDSRLFLMYPRPPRTRWVQRQSSSS